MKLKSLFAAAAMAACFTGSAHAVLTDMGGGLVYDSTQDITWLMDWGINDRQEWIIQKAWAEGLTFAGASDWTLPSQDQFVTLFAEHGDLTVTGIPFENIRNARYWSGTEKTPGLDAWAFRPSTGAFTSPTEDTQLFAVAVHAGNVAAVPEPQTCAMLLIGMGAVALAVRRQQEKRLSPRLKHV
jgi:PEP-CTERM motif